MFEEKHGIVQEKSLSRKNLIELVVVAIILSSSINLIAGQLLSFWTSMPLISITIGSILFFISILYIILNSFGKRSKSHNYNAFIIQPHDKNEVIRVPGYEFSESLDRYLRGAFSESKAIKYNWDNNKASRIELMNKAIEYSLIHSLTSHLADYFNKTNLKKSNLIKYERKDIPDVLLSNVFLDLFSRPMSERDAFIGESNNNSSRGRLIAMYKNGNLYQSFDLTLPKGSKVKRLSKDTIEIEMKKLTMSIKVDFKGFHTALPRHFGCYYLGFNDIIDYDAFDTNININVLMKWSAILSSTGWEYYNWVDSFLTRVDEMVSKEAFFKRIAWDNIEAFMHCMRIDRENLNKQEKKKTKEDVDPNQNA